MHQPHDHEPHPIPPPDPPRKKKLLGLEPVHVIIGAFVLIGILIIYLLLLARAGF